MLKDKINLRVEKKRLVILNLLAPHLRRFQDLVNFKKSEMLKRVQPACRRGRHDNMRRFFSTLKFEHLFWLGLFLLILFFHTRNLLDSDEGVVLAGAWNLANGLKIYKDFFEFVPPAGFYLILGVWKMFGLSYGAAKLAAIIGIFLGSVGIFKISRRLKGNNFSYLPPLIFTLASVNWPIINYNAFNIVFIIWSVYFFLKGLDDFKIKNFIWAGLLAGLSALFLQQKSLVYIAACLIFVLAISFVKKEILYLKQFIIFLVFSALPVILLLLKWPPRLLYENLIVYPLLNYYETNKMPLYLFSYFLLLLLAIIIVRSRRQTNGFWFMAVLQLFLLASALPRPDYQHLSQAAFPLFAIIPLLFNQISLDAKIKKIENVLIFFIIFPILYFAVLNFYYFSPLLSASSFLSDYVRKNCAQSPYLYAGPFLPELYFETRKLNPTPYSFLITGQQTAGQFLEASKALKLNSPGCAILNYDLVKKFNYNINNPVDEFISKNYRLAQTYNNYLIYRFNYAR